MSEKEYDDHQQIADMNMEGMPWYQEGIEISEIIERKNTPELNGRETRHMIFSALLAAMIIAGVYIAGCFLFFLFCTKVWF